MSLREIAQQAGVSVTTVSRIVNGQARNKVSEETRRRVLDIARTMRYRPNPQAVALVKQRPLNTLGFVVPYHSHFFRSYYFTEISCGAFDVANARGMDVNVLVPRDTDPDTILDFVSNGGVAGLILLGAEIGAGFVARCRDLNVPCVVINNNAPAPGADSVDCDNRTGAMEMTRHLLRLGHRRIAFIAGLAGRQDAHERYEGYRDALAEAGLPLDQRLVVPGEFSEKGGRDAMRSLLSLSPSPTAVFSANDLSAIGAMQVLKRGGCRIPGDMAVVGFDDIPTSQYVEPALTTVHQPVYRLGETAAEAMIRRLQDGPGSDVAPAERYVIRTRVVVRESCGGRCVARGNGRSSGGEP